MQAHLYRWLARSSDAFVAQFVRYVATGHYFYLAVRVPEGKQLDRVAAKLIALYDIDRPRWRRERRKLKHNAGIHLLGHGRLLVIMLTRGRHGQFYRDHRGRVLDVRRAAFHFSGYSIRFGFSASHKRRKVNVRLDKETYRTVKAHLLTLAVRPAHRDAERLEAEFRKLPYQGYEPVRGQLFLIAKAVNRVRRRAGYPPISYRGISKKVRVTEVFVEDDQGLKTDEGKAERLEERPSIAEDPWTILVGAERLTN